MRERAPGGKEETTRSPPIKITIELTVITISWEKPKLKATKQHHMLLFICRARVIVKFGCSIFVTMVVKN